MQINLSPELQAFVAAHSGPGTHFASATDFIAAVLQEKQERWEAARNHESICVEKSVAFTDSSHARENQPEQSAEKVAQ